MAGNISEFKSSFTKELAKPNRFDVSIGIPKVLVDYGYNKFTKDLLFRCESANLPGRTLSTQDLKIGSRPIEKYPYHVSYNDIALEFIVLSDMAEKIFFESWMESIANTTNFNFAYKETYTSDIYIAQYNSQNQPTYNVILVDAFPISINQLDLNWSTDGYHKLIVDFAYSYWTYPGGINLKK